MEPWNDRRSCRWLFRPCGLSRQGSPVAQRGLRGLRDLRGLREAITASTSRHREQADTNAHHAKTTTEEIEASQADRTDGLMPCCDRIAILRRHDGVFRQVCILLVRRCRALLSFVPCCWFRAQGADRRSWLARLRRLPFGLLVCFRSFFEVVVLTDHLVA